MSHKIKTRKNVLSLSPSEKQEFIKGVLALKRNGDYDKFVRWHVDAMNMRWPNPYWKGDEFHHPHYQYVTNTEYTSHSAANVISSDKCV